MSWGRVAFDVGLLTVMALWDKIKAKVKGKGKR